MYTSVHIWCTSDLSVVYLIDSDVFVNKADVALKAISAFGKLFLN